MNGGLSLLGKCLIVFGVLIALAGGLLWLLARSGGRLLPGDIYLRRDNVTVLSPVVSCLVLSVAATLLLWLIFRLRR